MRVLTSRIGLLVVTATLAVSTFVLGRGFFGFEGIASGPARDLIGSKPLKASVTNEPSSVLKDVPEAEYLERLARIKRFAHEGNFNQLTKEGDEILETWGPYGGERFARLTLKLIDALGNGGMPDKNPTAWDLREKYAIAALAVPESYSIESELSLVGQLQYYALVSSFSEVEAVKLRNSSKFWLHLLARIEREKDPSVNLDPKQSLPMHLTTAAELRKIEIENPLAAARLRLSEAEHQEKLKKIAYQFQLKDFSVTAEKIGTRFLASVYSKPPFSRVELEALLAEHPIPESLRQRILKARDNLDELRSVR